MCTLMWIRYPGLALGEKEEEDGQDEACSFIIWGGALAALF